MTAAKKTTQRQGFKTSEYHRLSGARRRPDHGDRGAGGCGRQARAVRHQFRQGQDDAARPDGQGGRGRHAQARRRCCWSSGPSRPSRAAPGSSAPCGRAAPRNTKPRSIPATSSPSPRLFATCSARSRQPEQSYSERQLYEAALDRLSREIAAVQHVTETEAVKEIEGALANRPDHRGDRRRQPHPAAHRYRLAHAGHGRPHQRAGHPRIGDGGPNLKLEYLRGQDPVRQGDRLGDLRRRRGAAAAGCPSEVAG